MIIGMIIRREIVKFGHGSIMSEKRRCFKKKMDFSNFFEMVGNKRK